MKKKLILSKIGANFILDSERLDIQAKRQYLVFEERMPEVNSLEELGETQRMRYGKASTETMRDLVQTWSG